MTKGARRVITLEEAEERRAEILASCKEPLTCLVCYALKRMPIEELARFDLGHNSFYYPRHMKSE